MPNFTSFDKSFAILILQNHRDRVEQWSRDTSNAELSDACRLLLEAGTQGA